MMLTVRQKELLDFIREHASRHDGIPPSFDEMKDAVGLASKSGIHRLITALEERGFIRRMPARARAIEIVDSCDDRALRHLHAIVSAPDLPKCHHAIVAARMFLAGAETAATVPAPEPADDGRGAAGK